MKLCTACRQELPKEKFSKKQWQLKQRRRCKECIAANREATSEEEAPEPLPSSADGEGGLTSCWTDEELFKDPPPRAEIGRLPLNYSEHRYQSCCGKVLCSGCIRADEAQNNRSICPFCRAAGPLVASVEEIIERVKNRAEGDDADAKFLLGYTFCNEVIDKPKKAMKLWLQAGKLGHAESYAHVAHFYEIGEGVERNIERAKYYYELAAMRGNAQARHNLACIEENAGNMNRAIKHYMIAAEAGLDESLKNIRERFFDGFVPKDDFEKALRSHQASKDETKSDQREAAKQQLQEEYDNT